MNLLFAKTQQSYQIERHSRNASERESRLLATDDGQAIKAARFLNIPFIISPVWMREIKFCSSVRGEQKNPVDYVNPV